MANAPNRGDHTSIDICDLNRPLATSIDSLPPSPFGEHCCIFRVDKKFRKKKEYAYTPKVFPIGPFHHDKAVTPHKLRYMQALLSRTANPETKLQECIEAISSKEDEARKCYSEPVEPDRNNFIQMMLVDGLFIIEVFRRGAGEVRIDRGDPIFNNIWILSSTVHDMILLENQLPMFVLQELFRITTAGEGGKSLNELAIRFFNSLMNKEEEALANYFQNPNYLNLEEKHLLDLLRKTFFDLHLPQGSSIALAPESKYVPAVTELRQAGVFFRKGSNAGSFLDIKFTERVLEIPHIVINDGTESLLRNVIALEQNGDVHHTYTMSYALFMNKLIGSSNDVALLCKSGIITNYLGDDECVSALFNKLCSGVPISHFHYAHLCNQLNTYYTTIQLILNVQDQLAPSVTELEEAGVKFRKASVESGNFLDISFANGVLNIPPIQIKDQTESHLLNIIASEHSCDISSYVILMDNLINTANDVKVLRKNGIIRTYKSNDECLSLFKKLSDEAFVSEFKYSDLCNDLTEYRKHRRHAWIAELKLLHLKNPWRVISLFGAILLLIFTVTQAVFAILSYIIHHS